MYKFLIILVLSLLGILFLYLIFSHSLSKFMNLFPFITTTNNHTLSTFKLIPISHVGKHNDKFGVLQIYPTKPNGREWFLNMENPIKDDVFKPKTEISKQSDDSWQVTGASKIGRYNKEVRMDVTSPNNYTYWKNIEVTGYAKVVDATPPYDSLVWYGRGIQHNSKFPCQGTSLKGAINVDGSVEWKKEIWHTGGYTNSRGKVKITDSILGRWIGWKIVIYNFNNDTNVKMESYFDNYANNSWAKVADVVDNGGWYANTSDEIFYSVDCGKPKDYIVTNPGPVVAFRSDNIVWDFKNLSVREILPNQMN